MENSQPPELVKISKRYLLAVYLILPILFFIYVGDVWFFDSALLPYMGLTSLVLPLYILFFELPHIIASFFGFADKEYFNHYKKHLLFFLPLILIATGVLLYVNFALGVTLYLVGTVWHGLKQQTGIALILGARPGWVHSVWTLVPIIITSLAYIYYIVPEVFPVQLIAYISPIIFAGIFLLILITILKMWQSVPKVRLYVLCVSSLFFFSYLFILTGYIFLAFFAMRFVHDFSAFAFYTTHDQNRNQGERKNYIYKLFSAVPLPVFILTPLLAIGFAYLARTTAEGLTIGYVVLVLLGIAHY